jgi:hypothetical protein
MYGCNIRTLLDVLVRNREKSVIKMIDEKVARLEISTLQEMLKSSSEVTNHTTHSIIQTSCSSQPTPEDGNYLSDDIIVRSVSSHVVWESLHTRFGGKLFAQQSLLFSLFQAFPESAATAGWLWEPRGHARFCNGGRFTLVRMKVKGKSLIQAKEIKTIIIDSMTPTELDPESTCSPEKYYIPAVKNNPTFDACFLLNGEQIALQFTISPTHSIKDAGFLVLNNVLPKNCNKQALVFVVPKARAEKFKCQAPSGDPQKRFKYYVLPLDDDDRKHCPSSTDI